MEILVLFFVSFCTCIGSPVPFNITAPRMEFLTSGEVMANEPPVAAASGYGYDNRHEEDYENKRPPKRRYGHEESSYEPKSYAKRSCYGKIPGYYGDAAYGCKTFEVCQSDGRLDVFYCPAYTKFNNYLSICDWHWQVDDYCNPRYSYNKEYYPSSEKSYGGYESGKSYEPQSYKPNYEPPVYYQPPSYKPKYEAPAYPEQKPKYEAPVYQEPKYEPAPYYREKPYADYKQSYPAPDYEEEPSYKSRRDSAPYRTGYDSIYQPSDRSPYRPNYRKYMYSEIR